MHELRGTDWVKKVGSEIVLVRVTLVLTLFAPRIVSLKVSTLVILPVGQSHLRLAVLPTGSHLQPLKEFYPKLHVGAAGIS